MAIAGILIIGALIIFYEAPTLYRGKRYKDLAVFTFFTALGLSLSILLILNVPIGSPSTLIKGYSSFICKIFEAIFGQNKCL